jgi:hypothetical protein
MTLCKSAKVFPKEKITITADTQKKLRQIIKYDILKIL